MNKENILKYLVPVVAVIVLLESIMLMTNLQNNKVQTKPVVVKPSITVVEPTKAVEAVYDIQLTEDKGKVMVTMVGQTDRKLDSVDIYVKYDTSQVDVSNLMFDKKLPSPAFSKISTLKGMVVANFLISNPTGLSLTAGEKLNVMTFNIKPKATGPISFEISTGNAAKESVTMIVENGTSKVLPFKSNKLTVNTSL